MTRILATVVLGAIMILTSAAAFAESNSAMDREAGTQLIEPATVALDVAVVSGAPAQDNGPYHELRLDNLGQ